MKHPLVLLGHRPHRLGLALILAFGGASVLAQEDASEEDTAAEPSSAEQAFPEPVVIEPDDAGIEEVVVLGRLYNATQRLLNERKDDEVVSDVLGDEAISRTGDSNVAVALTRISGLSLVGDQFIYVRGLGERYSSTMLNGATIPSPDLTRNVIPLDIFPTSIVRSLRVQKAYSADLPAAFGGGAVDIRTKGMPDAFTYSLEFGSGLNTESGGKALTYAGGDYDVWGADDGTRELPEELSDTIAEYQGNIDPQGILNAMRGRGDADATLADAKAANRELALHLNRDLSVTEESTLPDRDLKGSIGSSFALGDLWEAGFLLSAAYKTQWRETERRSRNLRFPDERTDTEREATRTVDITGSLNIGLRYGDDHEISATGLFLRNTDDETAIRDYFNENREITDGVGFREYRLQFEQREMAVSQNQGRHRLGQDTRELLSRLPWLPFDLDLLPDIEVSWFHSNAKAETDIPNQVRIAANTTTAPDTGKVLTSSVRQGSSVADYRFTTLEDEALNYGGSAMVPFYASSAFIEIEAGFEHSQKVRTYAQSQFSLGALSVADPDALSGDLSRVFSNDNITDPNNDFVFALTGTNNQSYIAANMVDALFAKVDWNWQETWRVSAGARWEDYKQVALDWNLYGYSIENPQVTTDVERLRDAVFREDKLYPALSATYMSQWLGAELFQLRFGWSQTVVRPDLREITDASYIDPITGDLVDGNPGVEPADVANLDLRAEWFFLGGDNVTVSLFRKRIDNPIEFFESAASDTNIAREIVNADSARVAGLELEGLKELGSLFGGGAWREWGEQFFVRGNLTWQRSNLVAGDEADAPTNDERPLAGASEYVLNLSLGFDHLNGRHTATLTYNVFGERLYVAGRNGAPDGYEQPFHALDFAYSWYPSETIIVKAKLRNILDEAIEIERAGITTFTEHPGLSGSASVQVRF